MIFVLRIILVLGRVIHATKPSSLAKLARKNTEAIVFYRTTTSAKVDGHIDFCCFCIQGVLKQSQYYRVEASDVGG